MDIIIKSKQTVPMTVSLPELTTPTTWTTPEASKCYFNYFPSSCRHLSLTPRGAPAATSRRWEESMPSVVEIEAYGARDRSVEYLPRVHDTTGNAYGPGI